jgi:adenylate cyclase
MTDQRRLAAILVADVVGYSMLVGGDEAGTLAKLADLRREIIEPAIGKLSVPKIRFCNIGGGGH